LMVAWSRRTWACRAGCSGGARSLKARRWRMDTYSTSKHALSRGAPDSTSSNESRKGRRPRRTRPDFTGSPRVRPAAMKAELHACRRPRIPRTAIGRSSNEPLRNGSFDPGSRVLTSCPHAFGTRRRNGCRLPGVFRVLYCEFTCLIPRWPVTSRQLDPLDKTHDRTPGVIGRDFANEQHLSYGSTASARLDRAIPREVRNPRQQASR
jgi:hypothetical protein